MNSFIEQFENIYISFGNGTGGVAPYDISEIENNPEQFIRGLNDPAIENISIIGFVENGHSGDIDIANTKDEVEVFKQKLSNGDLIEKLKVEVNDVFKDIEKDFNY